MSDPTEEWKVVPGFETQYSVSNEGRVRGRQGIRKLQTSPEGYQYFSARVRGDRSRKLKRLAVHRCVLLAFLGPDSDPARKHVNHIDSNPENNRLDNLEWVTPHENVLHACRTGRSMKGTTNPRAKLHDQDIPAILQLRSEGQTLETIAETMGVTLSMIGNIVTGKAWAHIAPELSRDRPRHRAQLERWQAQAIVDMSLQGESNAVIADYFKVSHATVADIKAARTWKDLNRDPSKFVRPATDVPRRYRSFTGSGSRISGQRIVYPGSNPA